MQLLYKIVKASYLQHIRSYSFLITLGLSLYAAYAFIPSPDAGYTTIRFGNHVGNYNSSWIGYVTAIMSSAFLSLFGYFLVSGGIKKDIDLKLGQLISATRIKNYQYLLSKVFSNFLVLLTIVLVIFIMSILLEFTYGTGSNINILEHGIPYLNITIPAIFFVSSLAVLIEVFFQKKRIIQHLIFLTIFFSLLFVVSKNEKTKNIELFGIDYTTTLMQDQIQEKTNATRTDFSIGFIKKENKTGKQIVYVDFNGVSFSNAFLISRFLWILLGIVSIVGAAFFFHRFNISHSKPVSRTQDTLSIPKSARLQLTPWIQHTDTVFNIIPILRIELLMLLRKGSGWINILSIGLMISLTFAPIHIAHTYLLPILWFFQVVRWSDLVTKDNEYRTFYFTNSSYKPLDRIFTGRALAGICLAISLAAPLLIRTLIIGDLKSFLSIILGAFFIISLSTFLGVLTKSSKLFEIAFLFITYFNINLISYTDYYGGIDSRLQHIILIFIVAITLFLIPYFILKKRNL